MDPHGKAASLRCKLKIEVPLGLVRGKPPTRSNTKLPVQAGRFLLALAMLAADLAVSPLPSR